MDENTIKVLARFVEIGQHWPVGAYVYTVGFTSSLGWYTVNGPHVYRLKTEICEAEANQRGIFRDRDKMFNSYPVMKETI
jgi:hypothetical protein